MVPKLRNKTKGRKKDNEMQVEVLNQNGFAHIKKNKIEICKSKAGVWKHVTYFYMTGEVKTTQLGGNKWKWREQTR